MLLKEFQLWPSCFKDSSSNEKESIQLVSDSFLRFFICLFVCLQATENYWHYLKENRVPLRYEYGKPFGLLLLSPSLSGADIAFQGFLCCLSHISFLITLLIMVYYRLLFLHWDLMKLVRTANYFIIWTVLRCYSILLLAGPDYWLLFSQILHPVTSAMSKILGNKIGCLSHQGLWTGKAL